MSSFDLPFIVLQSSLFLFCYVYIRFHNRIQAFLFYFNFCTMSHSDSGTAWRQSQMLASQWESNTSHSIERACQPVKYVEERYEFVNTKLRLAQGQKHGSLSANQTFVQQSHKQKSASWELNLLHKSLARFAHYPSPINLHQASTPSMSGARSCSGAHRGNELTVLTNISIEMTLLIITLLQVLFYQSS